MKKLLIALCFVLFASPIFGHAEPTKAKGFTWDQVAEDGYYIYCAVDPLVLKAGIPCIADGTCKRHQIAGATNNSVLFVDIPTMAIGEHCAVTAYNTQNQESNYSNIAQYVEFFVLSPGSTLGFIVIP